MDASIIKLIQRLLAELAGIGILIWGLIFIYRGIAGKINFMMKGPGVQVKLANASPGIFISLVGAFLCWYSMKDFSIEKKTTTVETIGQVPILEQWLAAANRVKGSENYKESIDIVVGTGETDRFKVEYKIIHPPESLASVAEQVYGDQKFWKLVAVANIGKGYFDWNGAGANTEVADSSLLEIWQVSKYYGKTSQEVIRISGQDKKESYNFLLEIAKAQPDYRPLEHMMDLTRLFKTRELSLVQTPANLSGGIETIGDLSLKYYGDKDLWPLITWTNPISLKMIKSSTDKITAQQEIFIIHFIP